MGLSGHTSFSHIDEVGVSPPEAELDSACSTSNTEFMSCLASHTPVRPAVHQQFSIGLVRASRPQVSGVGLVEVFGCQSVLYE